MEACQGAVWDTGGPRPTAADQLPDHRVGWSLTLAWESETLSRTLSCLCLPCVPCGLRKCVFLFGPRFPLEKRRGWALWG